MNANERTSKTKSQPKRTIVAVFTIVIGLIVIALLALSYTSAIPAGDAGAIDASNIVHPKEADDSPEDERSDAAPASDAAVVAEEPTDGMPSMQTADSQASSQGLRHDSAAPASASQAPSSGNATTSSDPAPAQPQKTWVEDTERVWVVDREAWSESVPVYGTVEVSVCNICGTDITGSTASHGKAHMTAGEGSGHHSEVRQTITGYNTVSHPEEGHWETKVIGGHWEWHAISRKVYASDNLSSFIISFDR